MKNLYKLIFLLLISSSICCFILSYYLFFIKELKIYSAIFLAIFPIPLYLSLNIFKSNPNILNIDEKRIIKGIFPSFLSLFLSNLVNNKKKREMLFRGDEDYFKASIEKASIYGEYGMGASTLLAMQINNLTVYAVDSDLNWIQEVSKNVYEKKHNLQYINLGQIAAWGRPLNYSKRENIKHYLNFIWEREFSPDLVLIDGRYRVACFLTSIKNCKLGTKIIFDDYKSRPHFHIVEEFIEPIRYYGDQAIFEINSKENFDMPKLDELIDKFEYVMD